MSQDVAFADLGLDARLLEVIEGLGFESATPIQAEAIPLLLEGKDLVGRARTGSGKTAAFGLPILQRFIDGGAPPKAIILAPTRELALQVSDALTSFAKKIPMTVATVYGGAAYEPQIRALRKAAVVVGTPGRVLDHHRKGTLDLSKIEMFVLDEADEMLRMGFIDDVTELLEGTPEGRQVALFSATMPQQIRRIANRFQNDPVEVQVESAALTVDHITQGWMRVPRRHRVDALVRVLAAISTDATLVFARTRADCAEMADELTKRGVAADALHGDLNQSARERVVKRLRARRLNVVIATDVAARGIDVDHITHVVNLELPDDKETYVHRIGRTGRVGREGTAITFATPKQKRRMLELARVLGATIPEMDVPSDAEVAGRQQQNIENLIDEAMKRKGQEPAKAWLAAYVEKSGVSIEDVAAGALQLLAERDGAPLESAADETPPGWSKRPSERPAGPGEDCNEVELFFPIGRRDRVGPSDFVGAIANEAGIPGYRIGRINIFDTKTFVGLPRSVAEEVVQRLDKIVIRGHEVPVKIGWGREESAERGGYDLDRSRGDRGRGRGRGRGFGGRGRGRGFRGRGRGRGFSRGGGGRGRGRGRGEE